MTALISELPSPPSRTDPSTFADKSDALLGALPTFVTQANNLAVDVNYNASNATAAATAAANSAALAATNAALANATAWVSGTTYAIGDARYSLINFQVYRRKTAGAGTTDPSADSTNWMATQLTPLPVTVSGTTYTANPQDHCVLTNVAATTVTLPASPANGDSVWITSTNGLSTNVAHPAGSKTIMGSLTDLTLDLPYQTTRLRYVNNDWRLV